MAHLGGSYPAAPPAGMDSANGVSGYREADLASANEGDILDQVLDNYEFSCRPEVRIKFKQQ
jgi:hypothetical protein